MSRDWAIGCNVSGSAAVKAQIVCSAVLSFLLGKFAPFPQCPSFGLGRGYFNFSFFFEFLDLWVLVSSPTSLGRAMSSRGSSGGSSEDLPIFIKFLGFLDQGVQGGWLWGKCQEFLL